MSVNDGYVMAAWGREHGAIGKIRMLGDGSAELTKKLGLEVDIPGMGIADEAVLAARRGRRRQAAQRRRQPGKFEVSDAETMLGQL